MSAILTDDVVSVANFDVFAFYDTPRNLDLEIRGNMLQVILEPKGRGFFARNRGSLVPSYHNAPNTFYTQILLGQDIVRAVSEQNADVDERHQLSLSQEDVSFFATGERLDIQCQYVPLMAITSPQKLSVRAR